MHNKTNKINNIPLRIKIKWKLSDFIHYIIPYKLLVFKGYIKPNGEPIKCKKCKSKDLEEANKQVGGWNIPEGCLTEYDIKCKKCGAICGHWCYGNWEVL